jgi:hypothetical protein
LVIVYSVVDASSLGTAEEILQYLWRTGSSNDKAVIVVGNKADLVRKRVVPIVGKFKTRLKITSVHTRVQGVYIIRWDFDEFLCFMFFNNKRLDGGAVGVFDSVLAELEMRNNKRIDKQLQRHLQD